MVTTQNIVTTDKLFDTTIVLTGRSDIEGPGQSARKSLEVQMKSHDRLQERPKSQDSDLNDFYEIESESCEIEISFKQILAKN